MTPFKCICCFVFALFMTSSNLIMAQEETPIKKSAKVKPVNKSNRAPAISAQLAGMTRSEKNTLAQCPLHSKHMSLNDTYRADAADFNQSGDYPFAHQLNYRRYCNACTRVLQKEEKSVDAEDQVSTTNKKGTIERCSIHDNNLSPNSDQDKVDFEKNPQANMPHAKQYLFKNYCKTCTTIYKIQMK